MKTLKVTNIEANLSDKNGKAYNKIQLSTPAFVMQSGMKLRVEPKVQNVVKYPESYLEDKSPQYGHDFALGENVAGDIVTLGNLLPYPITDATGSITRQATSASHVVLGDTDNADAFAEATRREFASRGKFINDSSNLEAYVKFWGFSPEGEIAETVEETSDEAILEE